MTPWQYSLAADGANNWYYSAFTDDGDPGGVVIPGGGDGETPTNTYAGIPILLHFYQQNPPRLRIVKPINGQGSWF